MKTNKTAVILIILLLVFALVSVVIVIYDINSKNQEEIIFSITKNNSQYIIDADNFELLCYTFTSTYFDDFVNKNIQNSETIKQNIEKLQSDSVFFSRIKDSPSLLATYTNGDWVLLIKTNINIKPNVDVYKGNFKNYNYIASSKFEKKLLQNINDKSLANVINSRSNMSELHVIEAVLVNNETAWACHDLYFDKNTLTVLSFYSPAGKINNNISNNPSSFIRSFNKSKQSYKYTFNDNKAVSVLKLNFSGTYVTTKPPVTESPVETPVDTTHVSEPTDLTAISPLPDNTTIDPLALYTANAKIISGPFYVNNHTNQQGNIIIQDENNIIYFLTITGTVKWRFNADSKIIGDITEVDSYSNNKIQYLFNTSSRMYLLTILGDNVKGFPIKLPIHAQNQILFDFTNIDNFNLIYAGTDNNAYILKYSSGDLRLHTKIEDIAPTKERIQVVNTGKNQHFIIKKTNNTHVFYTFAGSLYFAVEKSFSPGNYTTYYENKTNSKGTYITNDKQGRLSYISRNKQTQYTEFGKFDIDNRFVYADISGNGENDFLFVDKNRITGYDKFKKIIIDYELGFSSIDNIKVSIFKNIAKIVVYSQGDSKAAIFYYDRKTKESNKSIFTCTTCPDVNFSNSLIVENQYLYLK